MVVVEGLRKRRSSAGICFRFLITPFVDLLGCKDSIGARRAGQSEEWSPDSEISNACSMAGCSRR